MRIAITGGSGFIGRYCCEALLARGHDVRLFDLIPPDWTYEPAAFVRGDIRDGAACDALLDGCDAVLHLAAAHHDFGITTETYFGVNEGGARVLTESMDAHGIRRLCFFSSVAVYGDGPGPHDEQAAVRPSTPYGQSKLAGEEVFHRWATHGEGRTALIIRPTATFGPRNYANMYSLIRQIHSGKFLMVGRGENTKSLAYVENLVHASLAEWEAGDREAFAVFNYVDQPDLTSREIVDAVYAALGKPAPRRAVPRWMARILASPFDLFIRLTGKNLPISSRRIAKLTEVTSSYCADRIHARRSLHAVDLREGIARMVRWYLEEGQRQTPAWRLPPPEPVAPSPPAGTTS